MLDGSHVITLLLTLYISFMPTSSKLQRSVFFLPKSADRLSAEGFAEHPWLTGSTHDWNEGELFCPLQSMKTFFAHEECQRSCLIPLLSLLEFKPQSHVSERPLATALSGSIKADTSSTSLAKYLLKLVEVLPVLDLWALL